jgi:hypothetical protein
MGTSRIKVGGSFWLAVATIVLTACGAIYRQSLGRSARAEVTALFHQISTGELIATIRERVRGRDYPHLHVASDADGLLIVGTPLEFGAQNWMLVVVHDEGRVVGVGIRMEDSLRLHPRNAPEDNIAQNQSALWAKHQLQPADAGMGK